MSRTPPFIRVVVLAYDGVQMTLECIESLVNSNWPQDCLEIVLVDNGSLDDVVERVENQFPRVRVIEPLKNLGFAGGCNAGIRAVQCSRGRQLETFDHVALVNNDATVDVDWLGPLVDALESDDQVGAASPKILFSNRYFEVEISRLIPDRQTDQDEQVCLSGVRIDGERDDTRVSFDEGFGGPSAFDARTGEEFARWTLKGGRVRVKSTDGDTGNAVELALRLSARVSGTVLLRTDLAEYAFRLEGARLGRSDSDTWIECQVSGQAIDLINNVGSEVYRGGSAGDRGFLEKDSGQYDQPEEIFAWCGGAVLLRGEYLEDVGLFDDKLFLYYEDTDLSWRGKLKGWRYEYVPNSRVRHRHAQSSISGSPLFRFQVDRNRLLVLVKNAPLLLALRATAGEVRRFTVALFGGVVFPLFRFSLPAISPLRFRWKVLRSLMSLLPHALRHRWAAKPKVSHRRVMARAVDKSIPIPVFDISHYLNQRSDDPSGSRKPRTAGVYNLFWDTLGGGEVVSGEIAQVLSADHDVTLLGPNHPGASFLERLGIDLSPFEWRSVSNDDEASRASAEYDVFVNCTYSSRAINRAPIGLYYVFFPRVLLPNTTKIIWESGVRLTRLAQRLGIRTSKFMTAERLFRERLGDDSWVHSYTTFMATSTYTQSWIKKIWKRESEVVHPPVRTRATPTTKVHEICSIGRFFDSSLGHSKKQLEMLAAFSDMARSREGAGDWRMSLIGGADSPSRDYVLRLRRAAQGLPIDVHVNAPRKLVDDTLSRSSIYWHASGYAEDEHNHPERFEHFGISVVEAMAAGAVPLVFGAGGPAEIVRHGVDGFHWHSLEQLAQFTRRLMSDDELRTTMSESARTRANDFGVSVFDTRLRDLIRTLRTSSQAK